MKEIPYYPDYFATPEGKIFYIDKELQPKRNKTGTLVVSLILHGRKRKPPVRKLVWWAFRGYTRCRIINIDGNPHNNHIDNLAMKRKR